MDVYEVCFMVKGQDLCRCINFDKDNQSGYVAEFASLQPLFNLEVRHSVFLNYAICIQIKTTLICSPSVMRIREKKEMNIPLE